MGPVPAKVGPALLRGSRLSRLRLEDLPGFEGMSGLEGLA